MQAVQVGPFKLNTAEVAEVRACFETNAPYRHKDKTTFDEYLEMFANDCTSFTNIGEDRPEQLRISREMVRLVYRKYFVNLFPRRSGGRVRQKFCTLKRIKIRSRELPTGGVIKEVAEAAAKNGLTFEKEQVKGQSLATFKQGVLRLNHKRCLVKSAAKKRQTSGGKRFYTHLHFHWHKNFLKSADFAVFVQKVPGFPERFFIIPTADLLKMWGDKKTGDFYIPLERLPVYHNIRPQTDFWQYENAWHLLKDECPTS